MSVSAETYIVISLMFAVFAAVAAVGTSVVLGAGFERLRAGFELIKGQTAFFADAVYKLDMRTEKLSEDTAKLKAGMEATQGRIDRVEKQTSFIADEVNSIEQRILSGTPSQPELKNHDGALHVNGVNPVSTVYYHPPVSDVRLPQPQAYAEAHHAPFTSLHNPVQEKTVEQICEDYDQMQDNSRESMLTGMFRDNGSEMLCDNPASTDDRTSSGAGIGTLLSRYFQSENDKGIIYH